MFKKLAPFYDRMIYALAWIAGAMMIFAMVIVCIDVCLRYLFNYPLEWVLETCEYLLLYITFLPAAWILKEENHVKVDILINRMRPRSRSVLTGLTSILGGITMMGITIFGIRVVIDYYQRGVPSLGNMRLPEYVILAVIPFGSFFFSVEFFRRAYRYFTKAV